jgi:hypothetical protein
MDSANRRRVGRLLQIGIVMVGLLVIGSWAYRKVGVRERVQFEMPAAPATETSRALGPGDLRIYSLDSAVAVTLSGDRLLAGLSEKTTAEVRSRMERESSRDTSGLGGAIAGMVKRTVATAIGTQMVYPLAEIREVRFDDGYIVLEKDGGGTTRLFENVKVDGSRENGRFRAEDVRSLNAALLQRRSAGP